LATIGYPARPFREIARFVSPDHRLAGIFGMSRFFAKVTVFSDLRDGGREENYSVNGWNCQAVIQKIDASRFPSMGGAGKSAPVDQ
jgi:hypothetical protein